MNDAEILKDIPLIHEKITRCERAILDFERNIITEQQAIGELNAFIKIDEERVVAGKRPRYDSASMQENVERHLNNISLFNEKIVGEIATIDKFKNILEVLKDDLGKNPEQVFLYPR